MARTKRELRQALALVDLVLEIRDARIPQSSHNADLADLVANKPVITVLAKADLAEAELTKAWVKSLQDADLSPVALDLQKGHGLGELQRIIRSFHETIRERLRQRGRQDQVLRGVVVGVPNVGKSTLINRLARRNVVKTGAKPGVTRGKQWVRAGNFMQLLDVPGVLWPRFDDPGTAFKLAVTGAISDDIFNYVEVSAALAEYIMETKPEALNGRYGLDAGLTEGMGILEAIGKQRGFLMTGGRVDGEKAAALLLREFRQGILGAFTLEKP
ncbi:MAG: ribosome biogenesis GTPase YlqF [Firmicutes bacterium]|nr:ribosome biogenesis GTPase YlqF [Bacillota bacterium]